MKPPQLSWRKKACFALTATVLGLALLEGLLAVAGIVPLSRTDDPFVGFDHQPLFERRDTTPPSFETRPQKLPWFNDQSFPAEKSPRTLRIFCLGGSTTYGRPYRDATSFSGQLRKLLQLALPGQSIEVINAGGVSYASYRVERLCRELMRHQPDAVIVYTGHNEFLEQRTYAPLKEMSQWRRRATGWLSHTRIFAAMHRASAAPLAPANLSSEVEAMLDGVVGLEAYQRENLHREEVLAHFRWNLRRLAQRTSDANVPLVLVAPAARAV